MKRISVLLFFALVFMSFYSTATAATTIEKLTLKPGESKSFSIEAESKMKIGFKPNLSMEEARKCENNCIEISQVGGTTMASMFGATLGMTPKNGKIELALKNVEKFPIEVELFQK